jgi:hypothetical protein
MVIRLSEPIANDYVSRKCVSGTNIQEKHPTYVIAIRYGLGTLTSTLRLSRVVCRTRISHCLEQLTVTGGMWTRYVELVYQEPRSSDLGDFQLGLDTMGIALVSDGINPGC